MDTGEALVVVAAYEAFDLNLGLLPVRLRPCARWCKGRMEAIVIIALAGPSGCGKSTAASILSEILPGHEIVHFGDAVKNCCASLFKFNREQTHGMSKDVPDERYPQAQHVIVEGQCVRCFDHRASTCYLTPRYAFQKCGDDFGRACWSDLWVRALAIPGSCIIADVRKKNEVEYIKSLGGFVIRLVGRGSSVVHGDSEVRAKDCDATIKNDKTLEILKRRLRGLAVSQGWIRSETKTSKFDQILSAPAQAPVDVDLDSISLEPVYELVEALCRSGVEAAADHVASREVVVNVWPQHRPSYYRRLWSCGNALTPERKLCCWDSDNKPLGRVWDTAGLRANLEMAMANLKTRALLESMRAEAEKPVHAQLCTSVLLAVLEVSAVDQLRLGRLGVGQECEFEVSVVEHHLKDLSLDKCEPMYLESAGLKFSVTCIVGSFSSSGVVRLRVTKLGAWKRLEWC